MKGKNFRIYRSGAGSGKTFCLSIIYLALILREPKVFRRILGITFTNKAAAELKQRILKFLSLLSLSHSQDDLLKSTIINNLHQEGIQLQADEMACRAKEAFTHILHSYGDFSITTIDSFMHKVVSTFTFDLRIAHDFDVVLDTGPLAEEVSDRLLSKAGSDDRLTTLLEIILEILIDDDKGWNIKSVLTQTAESLFREDTRHNLNELLEYTPSKLLETRQEIHKLIFSTAQNIKQKAKKCIQIINRVGIHLDDFYQGSKGVGIWLEKLDKASHVGEITKISSGYARKAIDENVWFSRGNESKFEVQWAPVKDQVAQIMHEIISQQHQLISLQRIADALPGMALMDALAAELHEIKREENFLHISDFNELIRNSILEEPVPYIYYRVGNRFQHYLLDEFQDTSVSQWHNLVPLLHNSISQSSPSPAVVIVGDGKQSIYRFRNGELMTFQCLPKIYHKPNKPAFDEAEKSFDESHEFAKLNENRRSEKNIVNFNNLFFEKLVELLKNYALLQGVYADLKQENHKKENKGYVEWHFIDNAKDDDPSVLQAQRVGKVIQELRKKGYAYKNMAVLVRKGSEGLRIADELSKNHIPVISADALLLHASREVRFVIAWLYYLHNPSDDYYRAGVLSFYAGAEADLYHWMKQYPKLENISRKFLGISPTGLLQKNLYALCEYIMKAIYEDRSLDVHGQTLLEYVQRLVQQKKNTIADFLKAWEVSGNTWAVNLSGERDAVQVITIHKAKGLEFKIVLLPYFLGKVPSREKAWLKYDTHKLETLIGPISLPQTLLVSTDNHENDPLFGEELAELKQKQLLDRLNLMYVAFTRAIERLYIFSEPLVEKASDPLKKAAYASLKNIMIEIDEGNRWVFPTSAAEDQDSQPARESLEDSWEQAKHQLEGRAWEERFKIARRAPEVWMPGKLLQAQQKGIAIHQWLEKTTQRSLQTLPQGMKKPLEGAAPSEIWDELRKDALFEEIFIDEAEYLAEREIYNPEQGNMRPDLIIIKNKEAAIVDYKTGAPSPNHKEQIRRYTGALHGMGFSPVRGYLIYLNTKPEILRVV